MKLDCNNRFPVPAGRPVIAPATALFFNAVSTCAVVAPGLFSMYRAATPATCGLAMEVPEMVLIAVLLVNHADVINSPGAKISTIEP